MGMQILNQK